MKHATDMSECDELKANGVIQPWRKNERVFKCPWLKAIEESEFSLTKASTLIILQDWGCAGEESFEKAVELVHPFFKQNGALTKEIAVDTTLRNLWAEISSQTQKGNVAVTNAVWGLRPKGAEKTGYLGSVVHKAWFGNLLNKVIVPFLEQKQSEENKKIIFCGEWARDWGAKEFTKLSSNDAFNYLKKYETWAESEKYINDPKALANFEMYFFRHPSASGPWCLRSDSNKDLKFEEVTSFKW